MDKSMIDKLMEIKKLYEADILTKEEMEAEKAKVLHPDEGCQVVPLPLTHPKRSESSSINQEQTSPPQDLVKNDFVLALCFFVGAIVVIFLILGLIA